MAVNHTVSHIDPKESDGRPYRSHLRPACLECRRRKSRCKTNVASSKCILCQVRDTTCIFPRTGGHAIPRKTNRASLSNRNLGLSQLVQQSTTEVAPSEPQQPRDKNCTSSNPSHTAPCPPPQVSVDDPMGLLNEAQDESPHVAGPALVDDNNELEDYLFAGSERNRRPVRPASTSASASRNVRPVVFTTVHRRPIGLAANQSCASIKCEIIEKLIAPYSQTLVNLFFEKVNTCFPVFSKNSFLRIFTTMRGKISPAVLSNLYANTLSYWESCPQLSGKDCPDKMFVWLQANEALNSESFLAPGLSTVLAMILNIGGRPSTSVFGNGSLIGTAVARANALGLNRDPTDWDISEAEQLFRIKIWWLLFMQDRWWSLAYGLPLQINWNQFDVPVPKVAQLTRIDELPARDLATVIFVAMIHLTIVLSQILEHIYHVADPNANINERSNNRFENLLNEWEKSQNDEVRRIIFRGVNLSGPGAANLRMAYLSVKFLLRRLQASIRISESQRDIESASQGLIHVQRAAEEIVLLIQELDEHQTRDFWFPMHAYSITSATTFLIRNAYSPTTTNQNMKRQMVIDMIKALRGLKQKYSWDLADNCLSTYGSIVEKLGASTAESQPVFVQSDAVQDIDMSEWSGFCEGLDDYMFADFEDFLRSYPT